MSDFNTSKVDGNTVGSAEWNQLSDVDNLTTTSGQTPSTTDLFQLSIASARYSSGGQFFTDSGTANTYVLSPVSPFKSPVDATNTYFNGMTIRFRAGNANSGASTVNINGAGLKNLKKEDGSTDLTTGDIITTKDCRFRYNGTSFVLIQDSILATTTTQGVAFLSNPITIANNATDANNDIDFSAGNFNFSDGSGQVLVLAVMTKRLDATWSAGTNQGGLLNGTAVPKAINSTYHCYKIYNPTTGTEDSAFLLGILGTAPDPTSALPSGYTKFKLIGSIRTDGSGNIRNGNYVFFLGGYKFIYNTVVADATSVALTTTRSSLSITVPAGVSTTAIFTPSCLATNSIDTVLLYQGGTSINEARVMVGSDGINHFSGSTVFVKTNLSSQIDWAMQGGTKTASLTTHGFIHYTN
jgi:hypothetical protein